MKAVYSVDLIIVLVFSITAYAGEKKTVNINIEGMTYNQTLQSWIFLYKKLSQP